MALLLESYIYFGLIRYYSSISKTWHIFSANFSLIKPYPIVQELTNIVAIILFFSIHYILNKVSQKRFFGIKDKEIIKLLFLSLEKVTLFPSQYF